MDTNNYQKQQENHHTIKLAYTPILPNQTQVDCKVMNQY